MRKAMWILSAIFVCTNFETSASSFADFINRQPVVRESKAVRFGRGASESVKPSVDPPVAEDASARQSYYSLFGNNFGSQNRRRCPMCDSSVFPYCGEKLFHDACCCTDPYQYPLPYKCQFADCAFLHSNSCREHRLIANCCCSDEYRSLLRGRDTPLSRSVGQVRRKDRYWDVCQETNKAACSFDRVTRLLGSYLLFTCSQ